MKLWINWHHSAIVVAESVDDAADYLSLFLSKEVARSEQFEESPFIDGMVWIFNPRPSPGRASKEGKIMKGKSKPGKTSKKPPMKKC